MDLLLRIPTADSFHVSQVGVVHADEQVIGTVVSGAHLNCDFACTIDSGLAEDTF